MTQTVAPPDADAAGVPPDLRRTAFVLVAGAVAVILDTTIVSVALRDLSGALRVSVSDVQWVSTAYLLAMFVVIPVSGWAQSRLGGKRLWILALSVFLAGSLLCALAWDLPSLVAFRVVQGLGGGVMLPLLTTILMQAAGGRNLGRLMATVSLPIALGPILGPVVGGLVLSALSWQWIFLINLPLGAIGLALAVRLLPADGAADPRRLDWVGLLLVTPGVVGVIYGLSEVGSHDGFGHTGVLLPLVAGSALVAAFTLWSLRAGERALVDLRLFRHRSVSATTVLMVLTGAVLYGAMLLLPLYYQEVRGSDALGAGLLLIPQGVGALASRSLAGRLTDAVGGRWVAAVGFAVIALGTVPFALAGPTTSTWLLGSALVVRGLGLGAVVIPLMTGAFVGLDRSEMPHASILTRVAQQLGGSLGIAVLAVVLVNATAGAAPGDGAFDVAFWWAVGLSLLAVPLSMLVPGRRPLSS